MAKIFRKIRQKLLAENKVKKYLLYAVGEIILVVIGILIALQINNINQNRQQEKLERTLLRQVRFELLENYEDIWRDAENLALGIKSHYDIERYITQDKRYVDSLCFAFYWIKKDEYIQPASAGYSRLKEEGLDIIQNDTIRTALQSLYEGYFPRLTKNNSFNPDISATFNNYYLDAFKPNLDSTLLFDFQLANDTVGTRIYADVHYVFPRVNNEYGIMQTIGYVPLDFEALKKDTKFRMLMEQTKWYRDSKSGRYSSVKLTIKELIKIIDRELE